MQVELPEEFYNPRGNHPIPQRKIGRVFDVRNDRSIRSITREIHARSDIDSFGLVRFNVPDPHGKLSRPILTMESDYKGISLPTHRKIALYVGKQLHRRYRCQVQIVWSANKSYHVHFRPNRRNLLETEAKAIQKFLTNQMEQLVQNRYKLPDFSFDKNLAGRLQLVRLGNGTRVQIGTKRVDRRQPIIRYLHSDFDDPATTFPITPEIKQAIRSSAVRKARSRSKAAGKLHPRPSDKSLADYAAFLKAIGSTVIPDRWGNKINGTPVLVCYYSDKDDNPSCVLGLDSNFVTDSRGSKYPVGWSYNDFRQATKFDFRSAASANRVARKMRKDFKRRFSKQLRYHPADCIKVICAPYGIRKTTGVCRMADAAVFPILLGFFTRELRDKTHQWIQDHLPNKKVLKLISPMEHLQEHFPDFDSARFYRELDDAPPGTYFGKALEQYVYAHHDPAQAGRILSLYRKQQRIFILALERFYAGEFDLALITQQGLVNRIIHGRDFTIPAKINVILDELETGVWAENEDDPKSNAKAHQLIASGGRWSVLTGESRPALLAMPIPFRVVDLLVKQFVSPIALATWMPLGVGNNSATRHRNRKIALPLLVAEERRRAKIDGKQLVVVGNVGQEEYARLGIRTFESLKGDNILFHSTTPVRIVIIATHPPPEVIHNNSLLFGERLINGLPRNPGKDASPKQVRRYRAAQRLIAADLVDKITQIIARIRGFRNRADCDVVVYFWDRIEEIYKLGNFPYVWLPASVQPQSIVRQIYNKGRTLDQEQADGIVTEIRALGLRRKFIMATLKIRGASPLEENLKIVALELWKQTQHNPIRSLRSEARNKTVARKLKIKLGVRIKFRKAG